MKDQEAIAYHARRLLVAPPRRYRVKLGPLGRVSRVLRDALDCGVAIVIAVLLARLLLLLIPGSISGNLTRLLAPVADPIIGPFAGVMPGVLPDQFSLLLPILSAALAAVVTWRVVRAGLQLFARPRMGSSAEPGQTSLIRRVWPREGPVRMVDAVRGT